MVVLLVTYLVWFAALCSFVVVAVVYGVYGDLLNSVGYLC